MMKIRIVETRDFTKLLNTFLKKRALLISDYLDFQDDLAKNPDCGDIIPGTNGVRKTRLKSSTKGKSGGFRVCYYFYHDEEIYLLDIYSKNEKENLTMADKKILKTMVNIIKGAR